MIFCYLLELRKLLSKPLLDVIPAVTSTSINTILPQSNDERPKEVPDPKDNKKIYQCKNCKNIIVGPNAEQVFLTHIKTCQIPSFECTICFKKFSQKRGLNNHLRITHLVFD